MCLLQDLESCTDLSLHCSNEALYARSLELGVEDPALHHLNRQQSSPSSLHRHLVGILILILTLRVVADCLTSITHNMRHPASSLSSLSSLATSLVPAPGLHHALPYLESPALLAPPSPSPALPATYRPEGVADWTPLLHRQGGGVSLASCLCRPAQLATTEVKVETTGQVFS